MCVEIDRPRFVGVADDIVARIEWHVDDTPDFSYLGVLTDQRDEYVIDRYTGVFLGEETYGIMRIVVPGIEDASPAQKWDKVDRHAREKLREAGIYVYGDDYEIEEDLGPNEFVVNYSGYKILRDNLGRTCYDPSRYIRYYKPSSNHTPHKPENWSHVSTPNLDEAVSKHGSIEQADIQYAVEDWERFEEYINGYLCALGCVVTVFVNGVEIADASVWGVESDSDGEYFNEVEADMLFEALVSAKEDLDRLRRASETLEAFEPDPAAARGLIENAE